MTVVTLSPKAVRFLKEAVKSEHIESGLFIDDIALLRDWGKDPGINEIGSRSRVVISEKVADAVLGLVDCIINYTAQGKQFLDWDDNDVMFIQCVGDGIRADLQLQPVSVY